MSIYSVYYLVAHGIRQIIVSLNTGIQALLGNMLAKNEREELDKTYSVVEFVFHTVVTLLFGVTGILLVPFVRVYAANFTDADYIQPLFGVLMTLAQACYCIRIPYEMMIKAAGHYKQTQTSSFIEAGLNIVASVALVWSFGLNGVALGTVIAMSYRTVYLVFYLSRNILCRKVSYFVKQLLVDGICILAMVAATCWIKLQAVSYLSWVWMAVQVGVICLAICIFINWLFYRDMFAGAAKILMRRGNKKK